MAKDVVINYFIKLYARATNIVEALENQPQNRQLAQNFMRIDKSAVRLCVYLYMFTISH